MTDESGSIWVFAADQPTSPTADVRRGLRDTLERATARANEIAVSTLQENMRRFLNGLDSIISAAPNIVGGLMLDEVEIHAQIDGKGNVGISGIAGAEFAAQSGIKFVLRRKM